MKKVLLSFLLVFMALIVVANDVEARRLGGGGRPIGRQSQSMRQAPSAPSQSQSVSPARPPADTASRSLPQQPAALPRPSSPMGGMLGGALLGLGAGSLLSHMGGSGMGAGMGQSGGGGIGTILLLALIVGGVIFLIRRSRRRS
ncbi:MAG: tim44-like domain protein [Herminiimonas sp.]|nr:tim44-like domain protein [Herminiimonas sp.]MDB5856196.1 tim44-like domain protein [Herminiimonas sp.]